MQPDWQVYIITGDGPTRPYIERFLRSTGLAVSARATWTEFLDDAPHLKTGCILLDVTETGADTELLSLVEPICFEIPLPWPPISRPDWKATNSAYGLPPRRSRWRKLAWR